ncbi:RNA-directed DNA polymerase, eukaryota [Tanacetum coccineum]|uniref:RNA-directed DNA polymerase, eukaryota n=1 Tax=Tanacetum coccineum TaxID=301880 RepID=A0ABQ4YMH7_9ASTR
MNGKQSGQANSIIIIGDYLLDVLEAFGFGQTWCKWVRGTFSSAKASVLVNGSPSNEFSFHRGLKQGDPLSPYLFILIMESLHMSFLRAVDEGLFKASACSLSTLRFLKILENKLESMKILENKLESLKLQDNQPVDGPVPLSTKEIHTKRKIKKEIIHRRLRHLLIMF